MSWSWRFELEGLVGVGEWKGKVGRAVILWPPHVASV